jgi:hypothetical protein
MTSSEDLQTLAKEGTFAYHTARHNISFKSNDCSSSLINKMFDSKFTLAQTKVSAIIRNVIHPMIDKNRSDEFKEMNFLSVITDTSCSNLSDTSSLFIFNSFFLFFNYALLLIMANQSMGYKRHQTHHKSSSFFQFSFKKSTFFVIMEPIFDFYMGFHTKSQFTLRCFTLRRVCSIVLSKDE